MLYFHGKGVAKDLTNYVVWTRKAADQGLAEAQNSIGYACETGDAGDTDLVEAYMWYQLAAKQGEPRSKVNLKRLMPRLTPEQISEGERRVLMFRSRATELPNPLSGASADLP